MNNLKIGVRLGIGFAFSLLFLIVIAVVSISRRAIALGCHSSSSPSILLSLLSFQPVRFSRERRLFFGSEVS